jgi:hypothetical protein
MADEVKDSLSTRFYFFTQQTDHGFKEGILLKPFDVTILLRFSTLKSLDNQTKPNQTSPPHPHSSPAFSFFVSSF